MNGRMVLVSRTFHEVTPSVVALSVLMTQIEMLGMLGNLIVCDIISQVYVIEFSLSSRENTKWIYFRELDTAIILNIK